MQARQAVLIKEGQKGQSLEEAAKEYKKLMKQEKEDAKAFM